MRHYDNFRWQRYGFLFETQNYPCAFVCMDCKNCVSFHNTTQGRCLFCFFKIKKEKRQGDAWVCCHLLRLSLLRSSHSERARMRARRGSVSRRVPTHCSSPSPPPTVCPIWNIIRTRRLTLSCTFANTGKSCFQVKEMPFRVAFAALRSVVLSVLQCEIVKVGLQNRLVSGARLTWRRGKTDCFAGNLHDF